MRRFTYPHSIVCWYNSGMTTLPPELQDMVEQSGDTQLDRLRSLIDLEPLTIEQQRQILHDAGQRAGWNDPEMDAYDNYDEQTQQ